MALFVLSDLAEFIKEPEKLIREREILNNTKNVLDEALKEMQKINYEENYESDMPWLSPPKNIDNPHLETNLDKISINSESDTDSDSD